MYDDYMHVMSRYLHGLDGCGSWHERRILKWKEKKTFFFIRIEEQRQQIENKDLIKWNFIEER